MRSDIVALIPAYNEASRISPVIQTASAFLPVAVVDDGSSDGTGDVALQSGATVIKHVANCGKGTALKTGFYWARRNGYKAVVTLDADGQHDPADIPAFLAVFDQKPDALIIGRRNRRQMPLTRRIANAIGSEMVSIALKTRIHDNQCGFRLYPDSFLARMHMTTAGFEFEVEVIAQAVARQIPIEWVPVKTIYGIDKTSYFDPIWDSFRFFGAVKRARSLMDGTLDA